MLLRALDAFWFVEGSATRLAVLRILIGATAVVFLGLRYQQYITISATSPDLFEPVGVVAVLAVPIPPAIFEALLFATVLAGIAFVLGWRFSLTGPTFAALLLVVVSYRNSWSMIYHVDNLLVLHILVLGLTRSADALSLDALGGRSLFGAVNRFLAGGTGSEDATATTAPVSQGCHWEYGYPIRLLCAVTIAVYFLSATAKLAGPLGLNWALGEGLRNQVGFDALRKELLEGGTQPLAYLVFNNIPLATAIGIGAIVLELGSIVALFDERIGRHWAVAAYGMHWGIYAVMGITFWYQLIGVAFAPFLVSEGLVRWCRAEALRRVRARTILRA